MRKHPFIRTTSAIVRRVTPETSPNPRVREKPEHGCRLASSGPGRHTFLSFHPPRLKRVALTIA